MRKKKADHFRSAAVGDVEVARDCLREAAQPDFDESKQITVMSDRRRAALLKLARERLTRAISTLRDEELELTDDWAGAIADEAFGTLEPKPS